MPAILTFLFGAAYGGVNTFIAMMANEAQISHVGLFFVVGTIFIFLSRPVGGKILDRKGASAVVLPGAISYLIATIFITTAESIYFLLIAAIFYGIGAGLLLSALLTWMVNLVESERRTSASATFYNMLDIGTATGILILGKLSESVGYVKMFEYVSGIMIFFIIICVTKNFF